MSTGLQSHISTISQKSHDILPCHNSQYYFHYQIIKKTISSDYCEKKLDFYIPRDGHDEKSREKS